jgi:hypothetical protein
MNPYGKESFRNRNIQSILSNASVIPSLGVYLLMACTGCSVVMANKGYQGSNVDTIGVGSTEQEVESCLGRPYISEPLSGGKRMLKYELEVSIAPSQQRAGVHLMLDVITLGVWEIPGTIAEADMRHKKQELSIVYGPDDRVLEVVRLPPPPPPLLIDFLMQMSLQKTRPVLKPSATPSQEEEEAVCPWFHPEDPRWDSIVVVPSLKPTLHWDPFPGPGEAVTYDLAVWPGETGLREVRLGPIAYNRQGLTEPSHHMEIALDSQTHYVWAVRGRYRLNDQIQVTKWSYENASGTSGQPHYCHFWTPPSLSRDLAVESESSIK